MKLHALLLQAAEAVAAELVAEQVEVVGIEAVDRYSHQQACLLWRCCTGANGGHGGYQGDEQSGHLAGEAGAGHDGLFGRFVLLARRRGSVLTI